MTSTLLSNTYLKYPYKIKIIIIISKIKNLYTILLEFQNEKLPFFNEELL